MQATDWQHGVFVGAAMGSETTAAATGAVGVLRRDPMAMLPFCGYNMADYFGHWLAVGRKLDRPPAIFQVNWFRTGAGSFLWPGFGENLRVLLWIVERVTGRGAADWTPIGAVPAHDDLNLHGLDLPAGAVSDLLRVDRSEWLEELRAQRGFLSKFGDRLPHEMLEEAEKLETRLTRTIG
jgi:phosphoenolpyruvate carboxykinase (GTP)